MWHPLWREVGSVLPYHLPLSMCISQLNVALLLDWWSVNEVCAVIYLLIARNGLGAEIHASSWEFLVKALWVNRVEQNYVQNFMAEDWMERTEKRTTVLRYRELLTTVHLFKMQSALTEGLWWVSYNMTPHSTWNALFRTLGLMRCVYIGCLDQ
jgi:hypothetical protein